MEREPKPNKKPSRDRSPAIGISGKGKLFPRLALGFKAYARLCGVRTPCYPRTGTRISMHSISLHARSGQGEAASQRGLSDDFCRRQKRRCRTPDGWGSRIFVVTALCLASLPRGGRREAIAPEPRGVLTTLDLLILNIEDISTSFIKLLFSR